MKKKEIDGRIVVSLDEPMDFYKEDIDELLEELNQKAISISLGLEEPTMAERFLITILRANEVI